MSWLWEVILFSKFFYFERVLLDRALFDYIGHWEMTGLVKVLFVVAFLLLGYGIWDMGSRLDYDWDMDGNTLKNVIIIDK